MLDEFLSEIVVSIVGKDVGPIAGLLNSRKHVNEFTIAKKLEITINQTRNILYKISDYGLVSFERQKDKKKGWYTYFWRFEILKCLEYLRMNLVKRREQFENQIQRREEKNYYICEDCNIECSEDEALLQEFTCDECGELFTQKDNSLLLKGMKKNLQRIDEKVEAIDVEIAKERKKIMRKRELSLKKEALEKEERKEEARLKRAAKRKEKELLEGKIVKKKIAKRGSKAGSRKPEAKKRKEVKKKTAVKKVAKKKLEVKRGKEVKKKVVKKKLEIRSQKLKIEKGKEEKMKVVAKKKVIIKKVPRRIGIRSKLTAVRRIAARATRKRK